MDEVTPCVGVWIEMYTRLWQSLYRKVTPCVGVWIEIFFITKTTAYWLSLPAWECGLKSEETGEMSMRLSHSLRGSVD